MKTSSKESNSFFSDSMDSLILSCFCFLSIPDIVLSTINSSYSEYVSTNFSISLLFALNNILLANTYSSAFGASGLLK